MPRPFKPNLRRYHQKIYFPPNLGHMVVDFFQQFNEVDVTFHAAEQLMEDKRGIIPLPTKEELFHQSNSLIECYEQCDNQNNPNGVVQKILIRIHNLSEAVDYCYVVAREGVIVSAWANDKDDHHRLTFKASDYYNPEKATVL